MTENPAANEAEASITVLTGHVSPQTAYVVSDYPYGFRLRCAIRYWVETTKRGQRFVSQTSNPKASTLVWNKPKASTYSDLVALYLNGEGHVKHAPMSAAWVDEPKLDAYLARFGSAFAGAEVEKTITILRAMIRARRHVTVTIRARDSEEPAQTREEQAAIMRAVVGYELHAMKRQA